MGFDVVGGCDLFCTVRHKDAHRIARELAAQRILVRPFDEDTSLLRFGLPKSGAELTRLENAVRMLG